MKATSRIAGVVTSIAFVLAPGAVLAGTGTAAPELDPGLSMAGLALLGGTAVFVIERYRRRTE